MTSPFEDQIEAAKQMATNIFNSFQAVTGGERHNSPFLTDRTSKISLAYQKWEALEPEDYVPGCEHLRNPDAMFGILASPPLLWCPKCYIKVGDAWIAEHPETCDACGTTPENREFTEAYVKLNPLVTVVGWCCNDCVEEAKIAHERGPSTDLA